jgi:hypothetical protein
MALVVLGLVALLPDCASACSCMPPLPTERELAQSSAVFAGEVVSITKGEPGSARGPATFTVSFRVSEVWKGPEQETLQVSTAREESACAYRFSEGREYLVYAWGKKMEVASCGRTTPLSEASADLRVLGDGGTMGGSGAVLSDEAVIRRTIPDRRLSNTGGSPLILPAGALLLGTGLLLGRSVIRRAL